MSITPAEIQRIGEKGGHRHQQVFKVDKTGLFWKRRMFVSKTKMIAPGFEVAKDRMSFLLYANTYGEFMVKLM